MTTRKQAINGFCKQCIYDDKSEGTWRQQVEGCTAITCPLFGWRPITEALKREVNGVQQQPKQFRKEKLQ